MSNIASALKNPNFILIEKDICLLSPSDIPLSLILYPLSLVVIHLAARAGVRPSLTNPELYERVNIGGTLHLLELMKSMNVHRMIFGSSSSVYGNAAIPFSEDVDCVPLSPYGVTKRAGELFCQAYLTLYDMRIVCLRFFTVYGPRNRPDMAAYKFLDALNLGRPIRTYGKTTMRDFTFVDDIVDGILQTLRKLTSGSPPNFSILNLGNSKPVSVFTFIKHLERITGKNAILENRPLPSGEMIRTHADVSRAQHILHWSPNTSLPKGLEKLWQWYQSSVLSDRS